MADTTQSLKFIKHEESNGDTFFTVDVGEYRGVLLDNNPPEHAMEGDIVRLSGTYYGPPVEKISIHITSAEVTGNPVRTFECALMTQSNLTQRFSTDLHAVRGEYYITILPFLKEPHAPTLLYRIEFTSLFEKAMQIYDAIFPHTQYFKTVPDEATRQLILPDEISRRIKFDVLSALVIAVDDLYATEVMCFAVVKITSPELYSNVWDHMLQLLQTLLEQHKLCYLILQPIGQQGLLAHLPARMLQVSEAFYECFYSFHQPKPCDALKYKIHTIMGEFLTEANALETEWIPIWEKIGQLENRLAGHGRE